MTASTAPTSRVLRPAELNDLVRSLSRQPQRWMSRVQFQSGERWFECLEQGLDYDVWLISWLPGQATGFHDHGGSSGAFTVAFGALEEHRAGSEPLLIGADQVRTFGSQYAHDVRNASSMPAVSIHAYSPPLTNMNKYQLAGDDLVPIGPGPDHEPSPLSALDADTNDAAAIAGEGPSGSQTIKEVLSVARSRLLRLSPDQAHDAIGVGAVLADIRPAAQRAAEGEVPGALIIERNVLEWRFDPASEARLPEAGTYDLQVIVLCSEGYTSSLAAAALQDLGLSRATDVIGGYLAWRAAGLPTTPSSIAVDAAAHASPSIH